MSDRLVEYERHPTWKKILYAAAFICLMLAGFLMVFSVRNKPEPSASPLGDVTPQILVDDTVYYWAGMSLEHTGGNIPGRRVSVPSDGSTYLPDGFTEYGSFLATIDMPPTENLQMQADFPAFGTVYRNPDAPEVIYALLTTDWFESSYVRFASRQIFDGDRIAWNGKQYHAGFRNGSGELIEVLPENAVSIGTLHFIGQDYMPQNDLETNCICDDIAMSLEGREVFADPNDPDHIYVCSSHLSSGGQYMKCPTWERSYLLQYVK